MNVYNLRANSDVFDGLHLIDQNDSDRVDFRGAPAQQPWVPVPVKLDPVPRKTRAQAHGDYPSFLESVVTERALDVLRPLIADCVEILPLAYPVEPLFLLNVLRVIDCLDYERAVYHRYSDGTPGAIERYAFKPGSTDGHHIFKIKRYESWTFVSDEFKRRVDDAGLLGFQFFAVEPDGSLREIPIRLPPGTRPRSLRSRTR
jgi:hypothetical protein